MLFQGKEDGGIRGDSDAFLALLKDGELLMAGKYMVQENSGNHVLKN